MGGHTVMIEEDKAIGDFTAKEQKKKHDWKAGRKFIAFILCLVALVVMSVFGKGAEGYPYIVALFTAYVAGNVVQKATKKEL